jgi:nucleolar protein 4
VTQARFDRFGAVKSCRLVCDKLTSKPKGTAFIEFRTPEPAAAAAAACARARAGTGPQVTVQGVALSVDLALTQDGARQLGQERAGGSAHGGAAGHSNGGVGVTGPGGKFDRRNLYLLKEGFIEEGSPVWASLSESDRCAPGVRVAAGARAGVCACAPVCRVAQAADTCC